MSFWRDVAFVLVELRPVEEALLVVAVVVCVTGEILEGFEAAPHADHLVKALLHEFEDVDDLVDALPGQILEVAGLVEADDAVEDGADMVVVAGIDPGRAQHVGAGLDLLDGREDVRRRLLGGADDGIELAGNAAHALSFELGAVDRGDLLLGRGDRVLHGVELGAQLIDFADFLAVGLDDVARQALARVEEALQLHDRRQNLAQAGIVAGLCRGLVARRDGTLIGPKDLFDPIAFSGE